MLYYYMQVNPFYLKKNSKVTYTIHMKYSLLAYINFFVNSRSEFFMVSLKFLLILTLLYEVSEASFTFNQSYF